jgi:hypothetical protein
VGKIRERIKAWRRKQDEPATRTDKTDDWLTVGKSFRATDVVFDKNLPISSRDEGRPPH